MAPHSSSIPVEVVFNPNWWFRNYDVSFDESFYLDRNQRVANDVAMRRALYERFGIGQADPQPRPIVGSQHIAGGFVLPALLGVEIRFSQREAAWPVPLNLTREKIHALRVPDIPTTWPMNRLIADTPMGRIGQPEEIASIIRFLLSEESSFMTGETLAASGGRVTLP